MNRNQCLCIIIKYRKMKKLLLLAILPLLFISCKNDKDNNVSAVTLNAQVIGSNNTYQITDVSNSAIYATEDSTVAVVSAQGLISSVRCGETTVKVVDGSDVQLIKVSVTPIYKFPEIPDIQIGKTSLSDIESFAKTLNGATLTTTLQSGEMNMQYSISSSTSLVSSYDFILSNNVLNGYCILLNKANIKISDILGYYEERYQCSSQGSNCLKIKNNYGETFYLYYGTLNDYYQIMNNLDT